MIVKFITVKGQGNIAAAPFYVGFVQHDRTMSRRETYEYCAERTGFKAAAIRAMFLALAEFIKENQRKGNITYLDGIASIRNYVKGSFAGLAGPWVKGVNYLSVQAVEMEPFKTLLAAILPVNNSEGAKPAINTVLDETTLVYDVITGTDVFLFQTNLICGSKPRRTAIALRRGSRGCYRLAHWPGEAGGPQLCYRVPNSEPVPSALDLAHSSQPPRQEMRLHLFS